MLTRTSEYALRAMIYLAEHKNGRLVPGNRIAAQTNIPSKYLSKILGDLVRAGVLEAAPGKTGGFRMSGSPNDIRLTEVLAPFEPMLASLRPCPFGKKVCSDEDPCPGHDRWKHVRDTYSRFLEQTSVHDIAVHAPKRRKTSKRRRTRR